MNIINTSLTLNQSVANQTMDCIAACRVELDALELASLVIPGNSFTLSCVLLAGDPGPDAVIFTYDASQNRTFNNAEDILDPDHFFRSTLGLSILNEDNNGDDEITARFTLVNNSTGVSIQARSARAEIAL